MATAIPAPLPLCPPEAANLQGRAPVTLQGVCVVCCMCILECGRRSFSQASYVMISIVVEAGISYLAP